MLIIIVEEWKWRNLHKKVFTAEYAEFAELGRSAMFGDELQIGFGAVKMILCLRQDRRCG